MKPSLLIMAVALAAVSAPGLRADTLEINLSGDIRLGRRPPPPPPEVVVIVDAPEARGPSPWERGRFYQRRQGYYYYPGGDVYYRPADHVWFYLERGQWRSGRNLPEWVRIDFNRSVTLSMATDRPYAFHQQIVARYPSNYFGSRVRLRDEDRRDHDDHDRGNDNHDRGRDRDNDRRDKPNERDNRR